MSSFTTYLTIAFTSQPGARIAGSRAFVKTFLDVHHDSAGRSSAGKVDAWCADMRAPTFIDSTGLHLVLAESKQDVIDFAVIPGPAQLLLKRNHRAHEPPR